MSRAWWPAGCLFLAATLSASPARAEPDLFVETLRAVGEAIQELNFYSQLQAGLFAVAANDLRAGGVGARLGMNAVGFGGSLGGRVERYPGGAGGLVLADFEFRPLPFLKKNLYRAVDPFLSAGLEAGGGDRGPRATQTLGLGVDIGLFSRPGSNRENAHPVLTLRYQYRLWQIPSDLPQHLFLIGAASRLVF
jgi:hypothetical protein